MLPSPTLLSTQILPPWRCTISLQRNKPSPSPGVLVSSIRKNRENIILVDSGIPSPLSRTLIITWLLPASRRISTRFDEGEYLIALVNRLIRTCSILCASISISVSIVSVEYEFMAWVGVYHVIDSVIYDAFYIAWFNRQRKLSCPESW